MKHLKIFLFYIFFLVSGSGFGYICPKPSTVASMIEANITNFRDGFVTFRQIQGPRGPGAKVQAAQFQSSSFNAANNALSCFYLMNNKPTELAVTGLSTGGKYSISLSGSSWVKKASSFVCEGRIEACEFKIVQRGTYQKR